MPGDPEYCSLMALALSVTDAVRPLLREAALQQSLDVPAESIQLLTAADQLMKVCTICVSPPRAMCWCFHHLSTFELLAAFAAMPCGSSSQAALSEGGACRGGAAPSWRTSSAA